MSVVTKRERELRKMAEESGLTVDSIRHTGRVHYQIRATTKLGDKVLLHFAGTPSDQRARQHEISTMRKYAEGRTGK